LRSEDPSVRLDTRKFVRYRVSLPLRFSIISGEDRRRISRFYTTKLWDIGLGGVSVLTPVLKLDGLHFFYDVIATVRNQIMMQIRLPNEDAPITALGHSIRGQMVKVRGKQAYLVGIHFLQISEEHGKRLRAFIENVQRSKPQPSITGVA
jgi:hypothetical protein